ncbi:hypothetical protein CEXT_497631 [Caerostris extrusa]|uniref:Uncharacterized protein n=1 Tax=Caerostris extrusa TaxID=172846 RepID=A0AAV4XU86_CAEEX|nr:hypothetical protein CEXT_497631 [Caerostris extrusa]
MQACYLKDSGPPNHRPSGCGCDMTDSLSGTLARSRGASAHFLSSSGPPSEKEFRLNPPAFISTMCVECYIEPHIDLSSFLQHY